MTVSKPSLAVLTATLFVSSAALAEQVKTEAVVTSISGNTVIARTVNGPLTVVLTPSTTITQTSGLAKKEAKPVKSLLPGLIFTVSGDQQGQTVTAQDIRFKERDWRTAVTTKAGTVEQFAELRQAIIDGNEYIIREESTVYFKSGSAVIANSYKANLGA